MTQEPRSSSRSRALIWAGAVLPLLFVAWLYRMHHIPAEVERVSQRLDGDWKLLKGNPPGAASLTFDDRGAPVMKVPGRILAQGFTTPEIWLRRRFVAPPGSEHERYFFIVGDLRSGVADVLVNGEFIGRSEPFARGLKTEVIGRDGFAIRAGLLHSGENILAMHVRWGALGHTEGINDPDILIGPEEALGRYFVDLTDLRRLLQYGAAVLMLFLAVVFSFLSWAEWKTPNRGLYVACISMLVSALMYLTVLSSVFWQVPKNAGGLWITLCSILALPFTQAEFVSRYYQGERSRARRINAWIVGGLAFLLTLGSVLGTAPMVEFIFLAMTAYSLLPIAYFFGVAVRGLFKRSHESDPILVSGLLVSAVTGVMDGLSDLAIVPGLHMYSLGVSACAIVVSVVLIVDFTKISFDNKELSISLKRTNSELADALLKAQEASRLKSEFVANVSHELRTPLNSVINIPEGLLDQFQERPTVKCSSCSRSFELETGESVDAATECPACTRRGSLVKDDGLQFAGDMRSLQKNLNQVYRCGRHLLNLVNDVLDFSKLESGRMTLHVEGFGVRAALEEVVATLQPMASAAKVRLTVDVLTEGPALEADPVKFSQVFVNLVANAIKFSAEGTEVVIEASFRPGERDWLLSVRDQGIGIAPEHHQTIFESFRQVDGSNTRKFGGTGLGLSITRKLVEAHGGKIRVESTPGKGSTFLVRFPLAKQGETITDLSARLGRELEQQPQRNVLILDDEPFAVEDLKMALRPLRHNIHGITDPKGLAAALDAIKPDLLILDVMMPGISGLEVLRSLKARHARLPVLVSSGYHANMDVVRSLGADWIAKPWRSEELQSEVTRLLLRAEMEQRGLTARAG